tara:strand:- start:45 stop:308 length:264 start_codon:yes stop_codon:yes gene_type:complete
MQKIVNVLAVASSVVSLAVVGLGGYVFINKDSIIQGVTDKAMDSVLGGGFGGGAGGALGGGALPNLSDPDPQQAPPEAPAAGFGLPQ